MLFELLEPHYLPEDKYAEAGEIIGTGTPPAEWLEERRRLQKPARIFASFEGMTPTPQMRALDQEAEEALADYQAEHPEAFYDPLDSLPLTGGVPLGR